MAGACPSNAAVEDQRNVDRQAPQCDEEIGRGRRMGAEKTVRHWLVGGESVEAVTTPQITRETKDLLMAVMEGSQKPDPRRLGRHGNRGPKPQRKIGSVTEGSRLIVWVKAIG